MTTVDRSIVRIYKKNEEGNIEDKMWNLEINRREKENSDVEGGGR